MKARTFKAFAVVFIAALALMSLCVEKKEVDPAAEKCISTGGLWSYSECAAGCMPLTKQERMDRMNNPVACDASCRKDYVCSCSAGMYCASLEEGCILKQTPSCAPEGSYISIGGTCCGSLQKLSLKKEVEGVCRVTDEGFVCADCGNGLCGPGENGCTCPQDCSKEYCDLACREQGYAGNADCSSKGISGHIDTSIAGLCCCTGKRATKCGNGFCEAVVGEDEYTCPQDCAMTNGACVQEGGSAGIGGHGGSNGPQCCPGLSQIMSSIVPDGTGSCLPTPAGFVVCAKCGDGTCGKDENYCNCPQDCKIQKAVCGNGFCEQGENAYSCPQDCEAHKAICGNTFCERDGGEDERNCPQDCVIKASCGNGMCEEGESGSCPVDCPTGTVCGNGFCEQGEDASSCPQDCAARRPIY